MGKYRPMDKNIKKTHINVKLFNSKWLKYDKINLLKNLIAHSKDIKIEIDFFTLLYKKTAIK